MVRIRIASRALSLMAASLLAAVSLLPQPAQAAPDAALNATAKPVFSEFRATLLQANEVPVVPFTGAHGSAKMSFDRDSNRLDYDLTVSGIPSATLAHIHRAQVGVAGPVIIDLLAGQVLSDGGSIRGSVVLTPAQVSDLFAGNLYVNVHTVAHPSGEIRGQLFVREAVRDFGSQLAGTSVVPPVASSGAGSVSMWLSDKQDQFAFLLQTTGVTSATAASINEGPTGGTGPVVFDLLALGGSVSDTTSISGTAPISPEQVSTLRNGGYYVSVATAANPTGEIRGQLGPNEVLLQAALSGANEVPPVSTNARGLGVFDVTRTTGNVNFGLQVTGINSATAATLNEGATGVNGPTIIDLLSFGGGLGASTSLSGAFSLSATQAISLYNGGYYVNVASAANPAGEMRGQLEAPRRYLAFQASLNGESVVTTPVSTTATSRASLVLDTLTNELTYKVVTEAITPTALEIHTGTVTETGGIAFTLDLSGTGVLSLTNEQVYMLTTGGYYLVAPTAANPGGEIRGQIYASAIASNYFASLLGSSVVPSVTTNASGSSSLVLDPNQTSLNYEVLINTAGPTVQAVYLRRGSPGQNGPIAYTLFSGGLFGPGRLAGTIAITPADLNDLLLNMLYVDVQTTTNPGGELRGNFVIERRIYVPFIARNWPQPYGVNSATPSEP